MLYQMNSGQATLNLQSTVSAYSATSKAYTPHHPIACAGPLTFNEDNSFSCDHVTVEPDDERTRSCVTHSICILLFELLHERDDGKPSSV